MWTTLLAAFKFLGGLVGLGNKAADIAATDQKEAAGAALQRDADNTVATAQGTAAKASDDAIENMSLSDLVERERLRQSGTTPPPAA